MRCVSHGGTVQQVPKKNISEVTLGLRFLGVQNEERQIHICIKYSYDSYMYIYMHTVFKISTQILFQDVHFMTQDLFATKSLSEPILTDQHSDHSSRLGGEKLGEFLSSPKFQGENETIT